MPDVWGILASDIHLQARPPVARSGEPDWFAAMAHPLAQIRDLADEHGCPVVYAGDIFDRWNAPPEVINFALERLPHGYAIPGQHDLPHHSYPDIKRSAYWTLVEAGQLENLVPGVPLVAGHLALHGWPWGHAIEPPRGPSAAGLLQVAVVHAYVWTKGTGYPGAPQTARLGAYRKALAGYDVAVFGDNHKGFIATPPGPWVCNCGGLMRRKTDERDYRPGVGLILSDGTVKRHYLDTEGEAFLEITVSEEFVERLLDVRKFVKELEGLGVSDALDFKSAINRFLKAHAVPERVVEIILEAAE